MIQNSDDRGVTIQREIPFGRELIWKAITEANHMLNWWGPDGFTIEELNMDFKVGGIWSFVMVGPDGTRFPNHAVFTEIIPPTKLVYEQGDGERFWFLATILLEEIKNDTEVKTLVTINNVFPSKEARDEVVEKYGAIEGGKQHLMKLEHYIRINLI